MTEFRIGDFVCIDGNTVVLVTEDALETGLFDRNRFPDTRLATDEEKALYEVEVGPGKKRVAVWPPQKKDQHQSLVVFRILPPILTRKQDGPDLEEFPPLMPTEETLRLNAEQ
jgi:hypothetical protein